ncbi:MAG TPA: hypothetical protein VNQ77_15225 [Frankiaceae bacterium]|nr:hypothetical protein [Frankiaceae bacterium]
MTQTASHTLTPDEAVAFATAALATLTLPPSARVVLVTGSLVEGLGNSRSDVDIVTFADEVIAGASLDVATGSVVDIAHVSGVRVDHEVWTVAYVEELIERFAKYDVREEKFYMAFTRHEIELVHCVLAARAIQGADIHARWVEQLDPARFADTMRHMAHDACEGFVDDAVGALASGDLDTATLMTRAATESLVDAFLAARGVTSPKLFKWRQRILRGAGSPEWSDLYWSAQAVVRPGTAGPAAIAAALTSRIREIRARACEIELELPYGSLSGSARRSPFARLRRFGSEYVVNLDGHSIGCDAVDASIWALCTEDSGADPESVATAVRARFPGEDGIDAAYVGSVVGDMVARGVLEQP